MQHTSNDHITRRQPVNSDVGQMGDAKFTRSRQPSRPPKFGESLKVFDTGQNGLCDTGGGQRPVVFPDPGINAPKVLFGG